MENFWGSRRAADAYQQTAGKSLERENPHNETENIAIRAGEKDFQFYGC